MVREITPILTPEEGRGVTNANIKELFGRAGGPRNRLFMPTDTVSLPNAWTELGLEIAVEADRMYRFHASLFFSPGGLETGFAVNGPAAPHNLYYGVRQTYGINSNRSARATTYLDNDMLIEVGGMSGHRSADLWGMIKPSVSGTLRVMGRNGIVGSTTVYLPSCLEWW